MKFRIRRVEKQDIPFILSSWLKSFWNAPAVRGMTKTLYFRHEREAAVRLIQQSSIVMAVNPEDGDEIYGYIVYEVVDGAYIMHYVYVKQAYRRKGLATNLIVRTIGDCEVAFYSHRTAGSARLANKYKLNYTPHMALFTKKEVDHEDYSSEFLPKRSDYGQGADVSVGEQTEGDGDFTEPTGGELLGREAAAANADLDSDD